MPMMLIVEPSRLPPIYLPAATATSIATRAIWARSMIRLACAWIYTAPPHRPAAAWLRDRGYAYSARLNRSYPPLPGSNRARPGTWMVDRFRQEASDFRMSQGGRF